MGLCGHGIDTINQINEWIYLFSELLRGYFTELVRKAVICIKRVWKCVEYTQHLTDVVFDLICCEY